MLDLVVAWLLFPAACVAASLGLGFVVRKAAPWTPAWMLVPLGMAALITVTQIATAWSPIAPVVVAIAAVAGLGGIVGFVLRVRGGVTLTTMVAGLAAAMVFCVYAAPIVASGQATFAGYGVLGDTAIQIIGADLLTERGRDVASLAPSTYQRAAESYYSDTQYPSGALTALGALARLTPESTVWLYQPFLAVLAVCLALTLFGLARQMALSDVVSGAAAFVGAQPALVYSYYLQGSIKEIAAAATIPLLAWSAAGLVARRAEWRAWDIVPLAISAAALVGIFGLAAGLWILPAVAVAAALQARELLARPRAAFGVLAVGAVILLIGSVQSLQGITQYVQVAGSVNSAPEEVGNLLKPLEPRQVLGVWLNGDYRLLPGGTFADLTLWWNWFVFVVVAMALAAMVWRRQVPGLLYLGISVLGAAVVIANGSPWADGKAFAVASPALLFTGVAGLGIVAAGSRLRAAGAALAVVVIAVGVLWSNALAYHDASLAPRDRLEELAQAGKHAGRPLLSTEFEEYAKYVLRDNRPNVTMDAWAVESAVPARNADPTGRETTPVSRLDHTFLLSYPYLVTRRDPLGVPPASGFRLVWHGRWYEVWKRQPNHPHVVETLVPAQPTSSRISCRRIRRLARSVGPGGALVAMPASSTARTRLVFNSWNWPLVSPVSMQLNGYGRARGVVRIDEPGRYRVWIGGRVGRRVTVRVGDQPPVSVQHRLNENGGTEIAGEVQLDRGTYPVFITTDGPNLSPGDGFANRIVGPIDVEKVGAPRDHPVTVAASSPDALCGKPLRWVEAVSPAPRSP